MLSNSDRPLAGILLMIGFCILAPLGDALAKLIGAAIPLVQLLAIRFAIQSVLLLPIMAAQGQMPALSRRFLGLTLLRTILHIIGIGAMFISLRYLPLADALAIAFVMPFILLLLGRYLLDEEVGPRRLTACTVGFGGTLLVIQPSFAEVGAPALLPLVVAVAFALFMIVTRHMTRTVDPVSIQAISGIQATIILFALLAAGSGTEFQFLATITPDSYYTWLLAAIGIVGTVAHLMMTWSLRFAPSATLAPMQYLEIPFATLFGWLIFSDLPNGLALAGILITMASGLYIVFRERGVMPPVPPET
jgi:drug/metabolite transporter (DMT)-like permease